MILQRVAVVGAGAAGLCAARHILSRLDRFAPPVLFELGGKVGGTWCYDERVGTDGAGRPIHSSMYRDLRSVLDPLTGSPGLTSDPGQYLEFRSEFLNMFGP